MIECRNCHEFVPDRGGARCPRCREPLYERAGPPRRSFEGPETEKARCAVHAGNPSVGTCQRCGNFLCAVCRTRWEDRALCLACVERALEAHQARPEDVRAHRRQAVLALVFGLAAWVLILLGGLPMLFAQPNSSNVRGLVTLAGLVSLTSLLPALFGVGQGAAAIRARGERMIVATCGLILCGTHLGLLVGAMLFAVWTATWTRTRGARHRQGQLLRRPEGMVLASDAVAGMIEQKIQDPARMAAARAPTFEEAILPAMK